MNIHSRNLLVDIIKHPFCWPGGYEKVAIVSDGALLCHSCCRKEAKRIMSDIRDGYNTGWLIDALCYEATSPEDSKNPDGWESCDHCGREFGELA